MIHLQRYLLLFLKYSWLIVLLVATALGIAWFYADRQPRIYNSQGVIEVVIGDKGVLNIRDLQDDRFVGLDIITTAVSNISGNDVMLATAQAIGRTAEWAGSSADGRVALEKEDPLAQSVRGQLRIVPRRGTRLIEISAEDPSPAMAQKIVKETVTQFMRLNARDADEDSSRTVDSLRSQEKDLEPKLREASLQLDEFKKGKGIKLNEDPLSLGQAEAMRAQVALATERVMALEADLEVLRKIAPSDRDSMLKVRAVGSLPDVAQLQAALIQKESQFASVKERYLAKHPRYIEAASALKEIQGQLDKSLAAATPGLQRQLDAATSARDSLTRATTDNTKLKDSTDKNTYDTLKNAVDDNQRLLADVKRRIAELPIATNVRSAPFKWSSQPLLNNNPIRPNKPRTMLMAGLMGLGLAVGLVLLIDRLDSTIRSVDEAEKVLGLPVLAAVPEEKSAKMPKNAMVMLEAVEGAQAEAFRTLRASLQLNAEDARRKRLLVTSAIPAEGKTFCAINLASCLAGQGYRTLLMDCDLRRPSLTSTLLERGERQGENYRGVTDVLSGTSQPMDSIRKLPLPNLSLLPAGRRAPNPAELLAQPVFGDLLTFLEGHFDRIVIDSAPINAVSDSLGISRQVHGVLMVVRFGRTPARAVSRALLLLKKAGAVMAGQVLNRVPRGRGAAFYYYHYGDSYLANSVYGSSGKSGKGEKAPAPTAIIVPPVVKG